MSRALVLAFAVAVSLGSAPAVARAGTGPAYDAHTLIGQWLAAQNGHRFDAYSGFYAEDFEATIGGKDKSQDKKLPLAAWLADRKKVVSGTAIVETYLEQYGVDKATGNVLVAFVQVTRTGATAEQALKIMQLAKKGPTYKIWREETVMAEPLVAGTDVAAGTKRVDVFPKTFAPEVTASSGPCKNDLCPVNLKFGAGAAVPVGIIINNAEGEDTGEFEAPLRAFRLMSPPVKGGMIVVLESKEQGGTEILARRATILTADKKVAWTGDLLAPKSGGKQLSYTVNGEKVKEWEPATGKDASNPCRVALISGDSPEIIHTCGKTQKSYAYKGGRFR